MATKTFWFILLLGTISAIVFYISQEQENRYYAHGYYVVFILSLAVLVAVSFTGYYGGNIRHTEIHSETP